MNDLLATERRKYEMVWREPKYGRKSPGARSAPTAMSHYEALGASSLTDYGCGDGQARSWFEGWGAQAIGTDLVDVPRESDAPSYPGPLWDPPPELPTTDFAFSADVLEHLPTDHVGASIAQIREHTRLGGFLQVCIVPDRWGPRLGTRLHLTVRPASRWRAITEHYFWVKRAESNRRMVRLWLTV